MDSNIEDQIKSMRANHWGGFSPPQTGNSLNDFLLRALQTAPMGMRAGIQPMMRDIDIAQQKMAAPDAPNYTPTQLQSKSDMLPLGMQEANSEANLNGFPLKEKYMEGGLRPANSDPFNVHNSILYDTPGDQMFVNRILQSLGKKEEDLLTPYDRAASHQMYDKELSSLGYSKEQISNMSHQTKKDIVEGRLE